MATTSVTSTRANLPWARVLVGFFALNHLAIGVALLFAPRWFFDTIGTFPPFNRHYAGDLGAFQIGLGIGLTLAVRNPARHRALIAAVAVGNSIHTLNHAYDAWLSHAPLNYWLVDTGPLLLVSVVLFLLTVQLPASGE